jgi:glucose-6-phosphate-specific signal transduction histidine kinase
MKLSKSTTYLAAWTLYLAFAYFLYPQLEITVMLFSIPLTMLGGWLYIYRGALLTTILTIPVHFALLSIYSDDSKIIMEAFNPFGIGSQLIFSGCTALLKASQIKYHKLNNSLEEIVKERTRDLDELTHYLIDAQQMENRELNASLLERPYNELNNMLSTSQLLIEKLEAENHPRAGDAENIAMIIRSCIKQLKAMNENSITNIPLSEDILITLENLKKQAKELHDITFTYALNKAWHTISPPHIKLLSEIIFEAVANALRHAEPENISVSIESTDDATVIFIDNDGQILTPGFKEGMGVPLMQYRAEKIGATLSIDRTHTNLTRVTCSIPPNS